MNSALSRWKQFRFKIVFVFAVCAVVTGVAITHEGHAPLPTKGVEVDTEKGLVTLSPEAQKSLGVQTTPTEMRELEKKSLAYATVVTPWQQQYFVSSQLSGQIAALHVNSGDIIAPGQMLAEIVGPELENLQLELRNAINELDLSARQVERLGDLAREQAISGREFIDATTKNEQNKIAVQIATSKLMSLGLSESAIQGLSDPSRNGPPARLPLVSRIGGIVSHSDLAIGKVIAANEHLFEVNDISKLWIQIGVLENAFAQIRVGQRVEVEFTAFPGESVETVVALVGDYIDPVTHVGTVWAEISNPEDLHKFLPGMYGTARITTSPPGKFITVPISAMLGSGAERYVLVEVASTSKGHEYRRQNIVVAAENSESARIREGVLYPGDRVVTRGGHVLSSFFVLGSLRLSPEGINNVGLKIAPVVEQSVADVLSFDGIMDLPQGRVATISSPLPGTLSQLFVAPGQRVIAGQVIAEVAGLPMLDFQLEMLKSDREAQLLSGTLDRLKANGDAQIVTIRRLWETETARDSALNRRQTAWQSLISMGMIAEELEQVLKTGAPRETIPLRSPIEGTIVRFDKVLGASVTPDDPIFEVHDLSHVWVKGFLSEREAAKIRIGMKARIRVSSSPDFAAEGKIVKSTRMLGEENRTLIVWIELPNDEPQRLQRNLLTQIAAFVGESQTALAVPRSAIVREGTLSFVFVQREGGLLERRNVELGRADDRFVTIQAGLAIGEQVAVQGTPEIQTTFASVR